MTPQQWMAIFRGIVKNYPGKLYKGECDWITAIAPVGMVGFLQTAEINPQQIYFSTLLKADDIVSS